MNDAARLAVGVIRAVFSPNPVAEVEREGRGEGRIKQDIDRWSSLLRYRHRLMNCPFNQSLLSICQS